MTTKERYKRIFDYFRENHPRAETELAYGSPYELIVAVILSAQCTDKRVNLISPPFFKRFPTAHDLSIASVDEIFSYIKSCSYPNNKAKNLLGMAKMLVNEFGGVLPENPRELEKLPGVGRKTANVVASVIYNKPVLAVDTHVFRVAARIGLTTNAKTPLATELQIIKHIPEELISKAHHWLILHGRYICVARKPKCNQCAIKDFCRFYNSKENQLKVNN